MAAGGDANALTPRLGVPATPAVGVGVGVAVGGGLPAAAVAPPAAAWDPERELRALREVTARSRADEVSAMRRSAEEIERCIVRRQLDEGDALQRFCTGFLAAVQQQLEQSSAMCTSRLDELERKLGGHIASIGQEVNNLLASESLKELLASGPHHIVFDLLEEMAASVSASDPNEVELTAAVHGEDEGNKLRRLAVRVGTSFRTAASQISQRCIEAAVTYEANKLRLELTGQSARQHSDLHRRIDEVAESMHSQLTERTGQVEKIDHKVAAIGNAVSGIQPQIEELIVVGDGTANRLSSLEGLVQHRLAQVEATIAGGAAKIREELGQQAASKEAFEKHVGSWSSGIKGELQEVKDLTKQQCAGMDEKLSKLQSMSSEARDLAGDLQTALRVETSMLSSRQELVEQRQLGSLEALEVKLRDEWQDAIARLSKEVGRLGEECRAVDVGARVDADRMRAEIREFHREADSSVDSLTARCGYLADELALLREVVPAGLADRSANRMEEIALGASFVSMPGNAGQFSPENQMTALDGDGVEDWSARLASLRSKAEDPPSAPAVSALTSPGLTAKSLKVAARLEDDIAAATGMAELAADPALASLAVMPCKPAPCQTASPFDDPAR